MGVSIRFLISWGLQLIDLLTYPGGPTTYGLRLIGVPRLRRSKSTKIVSESLPFPIVGQFVGRIVTVIGTKILQIEARGTDISSNLF